MTQWTRRAHIFVRSTIIEAAKDKAEAIMPDTNEREMFSIRFSISGNEPVQAFGCNTALKLIYVQQLKSELIDTNPNKVTWFLLDAADETLLATNSQTVIVSGQEWAWQDSIDNVGLLRIEEEQI